MGKVSKKAAALKTRIVLWCNGSTRVFGSLSGGSNPPGTTHNGELWFSEDKTMVRFFCYYNINDV